MFHSSGLLLVNRTRNQPCLNISFVIDEGLGVLHDGSFRFPEKIGRQHSRSFGFSSRTRAAMACDYDDVLELCNDKDMKERC